MLCVSYPQKQRVAFDMLAFIVFLIGYTLSQFYRSFLAVIAPELSAQLQLSATDLGNISACWFATFALSQFFVGTVALEAMLGENGAHMFVELGHFRRRSGSLPHKAGSQ